MNRIKYFTMQSINKLFWHPEKSYPSMYDQIGLKFIPYFELEDK